MAAAAAGNCGPNWWSTTTSTGGYGQMLSFGLENWFSGQSMVHSLELYAVATSGSYVGIDLGNMYYVPASGNCRC